MTEPSIRWQWKTFPELTGAELYDLMRLRQEIFVVEQDCAYLDADGRDVEARHLLGWHDGALVAYLRVFAPHTDSHPEAVIGRVVVADSQRGCGLGMRLMLEGHRRIEMAFGPQPIWLSAQRHLADWYGRMGYAICGPGYDEDGIPHVPMRRPADPESGRSS